MLQKIMRRGTNSLGTDVPSEREINRLAARTEEEFWLFEKMDEERRQKERYKSRLMEEKEVPEWAFSKTNQERSKGSIGHSQDALSNELSGKRRRKEVIYTDSLSDIQWMKAVEAGEDLSKIASSAGKRKRQPLDAYEYREPLSDAYESLSDEVVGQNVPRMKTIQDTLAVEDVGGNDFLSRTPAKYKSGILLNKRDDGDSDANNWQENIVTWRTHKRKRSGNGLSSSTSDVNG